MCDELHPNVVWVVIFLQMCDELHPNVVWVVIFLQMCDELHPNVVWGIRFRSGHNSQTMWKCNYVGKTIKNCINWMPCFGFWHVLDFIFYYYYYYFKISESKFQAIMFLRMKHDAHFEPSLEYSSLNFLAHLYLLFVEFVNFYYIFFFFFLLDLLFHFLLFKICWLFILGLIFQIWLLLVDKLNEFFIVCSLVLFFLIHFLI